MMIMNYDGSLNQWYSEDFFYGIARLISTATPERREKLRKEIERRVKSHDSYYVVSDYCDRSRAVELGKARREWGDCYLYVWLDKDGVPFYAGKGEVEGRDAEFKYSSRSKEFQDKIREGGCHSVMVAKHISARDIDDVEKWLIAYLCWKGYPLVNKKDVPSKETLVLWSIFTKCKDWKSVSADLGKDAAKIYSSWSTDMRDYAPIISVLDSVIGVEWTGDTADITPKERKPAETLTYKGETLTWKEWGNKIGVVQGSTIRTRVKVLGWDVEKALYTPSAQA